MVLKAMQSGLGGLDVYTRFAQVHLLAIRQIELQLDKSTSLRADSDQFPLFAISIHFHTL